MFFPAHCFLKFRFMTDVQEEPGHDAVTEITPCQVKNPPRYLPLNWCFSPQIISKLDSEKRKKCLFGVNLHGKHYAATLHSPNHCGDSPQKKACNLGQM